MYFRDELHEQNFKHLSKMVFRHAETDREYLALSYILALPDIYTRCIDDPLLSDFPLLWTREYTYSEKVIKDEEYGDYIELDFDIKKNTDGKEILSDKFGTLSHGFKLMVDLAANLFNSGRAEFNLSESINTWDEYLVKVFFQALKIRFPNEKWF